MRRRGKKNTRDTRHPQHSKQIERQIEKIYESVFNKVFDRNTMNAASNNERAKVRDRIINLESSEQYQEFAYRFSRKLARMGISRHRGLWRKYFEAARKAGYIALSSTYTSYERKILERSVSNNFKMIKSIPRHVLRTYRLELINTVIEQVAEGSVGRNAFVKVLREHAGKHAKVVARTETAKLQTAITEYRASELGSKAYLWMSGRDSKTRDSHKKMDGVIVFWRSKLEERPQLDKMYGNAGEFPNCRCSPQPLFDESDISNGTHQVYDYRNHKVISRAKSTIVEWLEDGKIKN